MWHEVDEPWMFPEIVSFSFNSFKTWLFLTKEGRLFHRILSQKCTEFSSRQNDLAEDRNNLNPFLKSHGIVFLLK